MRIIVAVCLGSAALPLLATDRFSERLTAEERQAAGLGQLTPEQRATLDALVRRDREGGEKRVREQVRGGAGVPLSG